MMLGLMFAGEFKVVLDVPEADIMMLRGVVFVTERCFFFLPTLLCFINSLFFNSI
jgi:hypothetical protein